MKYKLPTLALAFCLAATVGVVASKSAQNMEQKEFAKTGPPDQSAKSTETEKSDLSGQQLVAQAAYQLLLAPGLQAKTRQSVQLFNQKLVGTGSYRQLTNGPKLYLDLDLKLQGPDQVRGLRQISDGDSLWEIRAEGDSTSFSHVNLGRLREVAGELDPALPPSFWMAVGGIPRLLAKLEERFTFESPEAMKIGEYPVWRVEGEWSRSMLAQILPEYQEAILAGQKPPLEELPAQLPHGVTLILGRDRKVPLFPYRFAFYRRVNGEESGTVERVPMVTWELFELQIRAELQPDDFRFRAPDQDSQDKTELYVSRLKKAATQFQNK